MNSIPVQCPSCKSPLPASSYNTYRVGPCPSCDRRVLMLAFPALTRPSDISLPVELSLEDGVSNCFYHEQNKAIIPCDMCGRFLCNLCRIELNQKNLCPNCLKSANEQGTIESLETKRWVWDSAALHLALLPLLFWPLTLISAPIAVACAVYSFFRPTSLIPRTRIRAYLAIVFGCAQIVGWIAIGVSIVSAWTHAAISLQAFC